ncbi:MAG: nitroreductase family protein [Acetivibrionales bacterium]|jgi:nitroreductase
MSFLELAKKRYSVRVYKDRMVEEEKLLKILEAGRVAPTAANRQPQRLIVVRSKEGIEKLKKAANIHGAPMAIVVCADLNRVWTRSYDNANTADIDASIVTDHMMHEATALGLGTLWICHFEPDVLRSEFNLPENLKPVNILAIGYADREPESPDRHDKTRKPLCVTVYYEELR